MGRSPGARARDSRAKAKAPGDAAELAPAAGGAESRQGGPLPARDPSRPGGDGWGLGEGHWLKPLEGSWVRQGATGTSRALARGLLDGPLRVACRMAPCAWLLDGPLGVACWMGPCAWLVGWALGRGFWMGPWAWLVGWALGRGLSDGPLRVACWMGQWAWLVGWASGRGCWMGGQWRGGHGGAGGAAFDSRSIGGGYMTIYT